MYVLVCILFVCEGTILLSNPHQIHSRKQPVSFFVFIFLVFPKVESYILNVL